MDKVTLWGRFGADLEITKEEFNLFMDADYEHQGKMLAKWFAEGKVKLSGETYFPVIDNSKIY